MAYLIAVVAIAIATWYLMLCFLSTFLSSTELSESNSLLALTVAVMQGYQKLFPAIFAQADFSVAKLIPSPSCVDRALSCDSEVLVSTLQLLLDTPPDGLMWQQQVNVWLVKNKSFPILPLEVPYDHIFQGAVTLSNILWLYLTGSKEVIEVALKLVLKVGKSVYQLNASPS